MSKLKNGLVLLLAAWGLGACGGEEKDGKPTPADGSYQKQQPPAQKPVQKTTPVEIPRKPAETPEAKPMPKPDQTADPKEEYRKSIDKQLNEMETKPNAWSEEAASSGDEVNMKLQPIVDDLEKKLAAAKAKFAELKIAADTNWDTVKAQLDTAMGDLKKAFETAAPNFQSGPSGPRGG